MTGLFKRILFRLQPLFWSLAMLTVAGIIYIPEWITRGDALFFDNPLFLLGALAAPLIIAAGIMERRNAGRIRFPLARILVRSGAGFKTKLLPLSWALKSTAMVFLAVAMARPMDQSIRTETETQGIDIILTLDVSLSMKTGDLEPTRLEAAKAVVLDFIKRRKNDRIGAVIFAENAYTLCPLTLDYSILANMISDIQLGVIGGQATAIGNAIGKSINRLRKSDAKSKVIILLTDGTSNAGNISPEQAATFAKTLGIKIYTVLMGTKDQGKVSQGLDFFNQAIFGQQNAPINRELLVKMSEETGGAFFEAGDRKGLESSFHAILDALEKSRIADMDVKPAEVFHHYLWPALILIFIDLFLALVVFRRNP
jgi:Ca-activated chloride channel homolog